MKQLKHLSPSSISAYLSSREQFYLKYLSDNRPDREPQTQAMSVGSAFDSEVKAELRYIIFGEPRDSIYDGYFSDSVEAHNRDFARTAGKRCFDNYRESGALNDLVIEMSKAKEGPKFEFYVSNVESSLSTFVEMDKKLDKDIKDGSKPVAPSAASIETRATAVPREIEVGKDPTEHDNIFKVYAGGVKLLGKPDAWYISATSNHVILDWKVNGYCSKNSKSPEPGYIMCRDGILAPGKKPTRGAGAPHKNTILMNDNGMLIDAYYKMEDKNPDWARQLAIYCWLCGEGVGSKIYGAIDQLVVSDVGHIRIAEHRCLIGSLFQFELFDLCKEIWSVSESGWFFRDMPEEASVARCNSLDQIKDVMNGPRVRAMYGRA